MNTFIVTLDGVEMGRSDYIFVTRAIVEAVVKRYGPIAGDLSVTKDGDDWTGHFLEV